MKKIIGGKKYDTETATVICENSFGESTSDFTYYEETLYQKKNGEFFLFGTGGAMTKYSEGNGSSSWGSSKIIPLSWDEAKEFVEDHGDVDDYEALFGEVEE